MKQIIKLIALVFIAMHSTTIYAQTHSVTKQQAYNRIKNQLPAAGTYNLFYGTDTNRHIFFVDEEPDKGWEHKCSYYYVNKYEENLILWPGYMKEERTTPISFYNLTPYTLSKIPHFNNINVKKCFITENMQNAAGKTYVVILSGGINKYSNQARYWNDCSFIFKTLKNRFGIPQDNFRILISDGANPAADMQYGYTFVSSDTDLDDDGIADTQYAATKSNLTNVLQSLASTMTSEDRLFLYVIDHGGTDDNINSSYIWLWNEEKIYDYELASLLNSFNVKSMSIVLGQCYSGGFIDNLQGPKRIISTACTGSEQSWGSNALGYDFFVYNWTSAINEKTPGNVAVSTDVNDDGFVTMDEAFNYAYTNRYQAETPQFSPGSFGSSFAFNESPFQPILMIRDNLEDDGTEPNTTAENTWSSPDIWLRNTNDNIEEHQSIHVDVNSNDNKMYASYRITNIGERDYVKKNRYLHSYWADASIGLTADIWLGHGDNGQYINGEPLSVLRINDTIPAGQSFIFKKVWDIPYGIIDRVEDNGEGSFHICFLAYISASQNNNEDLPRNPLYHEGVDILGKRCIAQINANFIQSLAEAKKEFPLWVNNGLDSNREYCIEVVPVEGFNGNNSNLEVGIRLSDPIYKAWEKGGKFAEKATCFSSQPNKLYMKADASRIMDIEMEPKQASRIYCTCEVLATEDVMDETTYAYDIVLRDKKTGMAVDGERFYIKQQPRKALLPEIIGETVDDGYQLKASNIDEAVKYEWYDETGSIVARGKEVVVKPTIGNNQYKLKVEAESDGAINYATITLDEHFRVKSISPNPFSTQITVTLSSAAEDNTAIRIAPANGTDSYEEYQVKKGEREITIYTSHYAKENYIITLLSDGKKIESRQIICK